MSLWIDIKYARMSSHLLARYKEKRRDPYLSNFRCPVCGDSETNKTKARGYLFVHKNALKFKCHNCNSSMGFPFFLKTVSPTLFSEYKLETFVERGGKAPVSMEFKQPVFKSKTVVDKYFTPVSKLSDEHECVHYCRQRMIPESKWSSLYYVDDLEPLATEWEKSLEIPVQNRLGLPFFDEHDRLIGITCRAMDNSKLRYFNMTMGDDESPVFGMNSVRKYDTVYCVEGPIDSLFIPNCIASNNSNLKRTIDLFDHVVLIFDNQPRNREIVHLMREACEEGATVVIWPSNVKGKDINEMVMNGHDDLLVIINNNSFAGAKLRLMISKWSKCKYVSNAKSSFDLPHHANY